MLKVSEHVIDASALLKAALAKSGAPARRCGSGGVSSR